MRRSLGQCSLNRRFAVPGLHTWHYSNQDGIRYLMRRVSRFLSIDCYEIKRRSSNQYSMFRPIFPVPSLLPNNGGVFAAICTRIVASN